VRYAKIVFQSVALSFALFSSINSVFAQEFTYKLDASQKRVVSLSNLIDRGDCHPGKIVGRVVKRSFDQSGTLPTSVTFEEKSGVRTYVNIDADKVSASNMVTRGWIFQGLQTLLREGQNASVGVYLCGAAGRVIMLNSVNSK
jgi:hypothetical protein